MVQPPRKRTPPKETHPLYAKCQKPAKTVKIALQMVVGVLTVVAVAVAIAFSSYQLVSRHGNLDGITTTIFAVTAAGLAAAAAIELAYALYTPGPDEALDPLILGLSSTFLFLASKSSSLDWQFGVVAILFAITLYGLFKVKERFAAIIADEDNTVLSEDSAVGNAQEGEPTADYEDISAG